MKKVFLSFLCSGLILLTSGCFDANNLDGATIYTTVYPITYFTEVLYGTHSDISSIYPDGADTKNYVLTNKQKDLYSKANIFIYNGLTDEKQIAKDFSNNNRKLQIIDVTYGLKYKYGPEEMWMSPSNALMLTTNIKNNLNTGSKFVNEEINTKYKVLEETLSLMDAEMRNVAKSAKENGKNTIVVSSNMFRFLEDYGFQVVSLENNSSEQEMNILRKNFKNGTYKYMLVKNSEVITDAMNDLKNNGANLVIINTMTTLNDENRKNNDNYLTIMNEFIEYLKEAVSF